MSDLLKREHAPVTPEAWAQVDDEARRVLAAVRVGARSRCARGPVAPDVERVVAHLRPDLIGVR